MEQARRAAAERGISLTALLEQGLRLALAAPAEVEHRKRVELPVCHAGGGTHPGVDLDDTSALLDLMEG